MGLKKCCLARALKEQGATDVWVFVTHALFSQEALEKLGEADVAGIVVTDTAPIDTLHMPANMTVVTVATMLTARTRTVLGAQPGSAILVCANQLLETLR